MLTVTVNNMPKEPRKIVVARLVDGKLWYYATFDEEDRNRAERCRDEVDGLIVEVTNND